MRIYEIDAYLRRQQRVFDELNDIVTRRQREMAEIMRSTQQFDAIMQASRRLEATAFGMSYTPQGSTRLPQGLPSPTPSAPRRKRGHPPGPTGMTRAEFCHRYFTRYRELLSHEDYAPPARRPDQRALARAMYVSIYQLRLWKRRYHLPWPPC